MKKLFEFYRCDNCGRLDPPVADGTRLTICCASKNGFYDIEGTSLKANGKRGLWRLRVPFRIVWRGWWKLV